MIKVIYKLEINPIYNSNMKIFENEYLEVILWDMKKNIMNG
jgi:hypothetical protein